LFKLYKNLLLLFFNRAIVIELNDQILCSAITAITYTANIAEQGFKKEMVYRPGKHQADMFLKENNQILNYRGPAVTNQQTIPKMLHEYKGFFEKTVGSTRYRVNIFTGSAAHEKLEDKIFRLITNEAMNSSLWPSIKPLQTGQALERNSV